MKLEGLETLDALETQSENIDIDFARYLMKVEQERSETTLTYLLMFVILICRSTCGTTSRATSGVASLL